MATRVNGGTRTPNHPLPERENGELLVNDPAELGYLMHQAFNNRDIDAIDTIFAADFYSHPLAAGRDALKVAWKALADQHPDSRTVVDHAFAHGDVVALRATVHGFEDNGKTTTLLEMFRVADGRIAEIWGAMATAR
ncbi:nuclear transport factor 2 family protein [Nocardia sp. NBC_01388]|uniref:nuclear transport factor 2 family protein n=1 Tax=Nocardia sp. NBC_01388 TaxID=2903596 RepID=UPI003248ABB1